MDTFKDINEAPKEIRDEVNHNSKDMHLFYSKSQVPETTSWRGSRA